MGRGVKSERKIGHIPLPDTCFPAAFFQSEIAGAFCKGDKPICRKRDALFVYANDITVRTDGVIIKTDR